MCLTAEEDLDQTKRSIEILCFKSEETSVFGLIWALPKKKRNFLFFFKASYIPPIPILEVGCSVVHLNLLGATTYYWWR